MNREFENQLEYFERMLESKAMEDLGNISTECKIIFANALYDAVYNYYEPSVYERTYQLLFSIDTDYDEDSLYIFIDYEKLNYTSAVDNRNVSVAVPFFVESGHDDFIGAKEKGHNQYHRYEARRYLELAQELIYRRFGIYAEIINKEPYWV